MNARKTLRPAAMPREFLAFLKAPALVQPAGLRAPGALHAWAMLVALHIAGLLLVVLPILYAWQSAFNLPSPDAFGKVPPGWLPPLVIAIAPVIEELVFRGWQTGRPRALWLLGCVIAAGAVLVMRPHGLPPLAIGVGLLAILAAALAGWLWLRRRATPGWYARAYPVVFYAAVAVFAALHLMNYPRAALIGLPMVLPQLWGALLLGFMRMRIGLPASILGHAAANATVLAVAMVTN
ncbi:CPBP family glutamic-type intramembrane protease [Novosphingobium album (ex Liu et al. 2023)]|uniref:CPBP family glutamic-type intramembrane protease n=1 Tax=Novosphingobium album (ex Liu et al. 2023) TaxID=3031130 RepID=A0ABT5WL47_9SPHN|nr:CPBP family glutamic-type intramembrane protease [Novosphingobium album (ex Liu et al. 2023)]MDE8650753.1 CPBP family glutamic-type intramembrane protease [Novosphingobium album (ex Liu et al. 2023)]